MWGKKAGILVQLWVPPIARRTASLINRKCRVEFAHVVRVYNDANCVAVSNPQGVTHYVEGEIVRPDSYDPDIRVDCTHGIHCFVTREEAEKW